MVFRMNDMTSRAAVRLGARSSLLALAVAAGFTVPALAQSAPAAVKRTVVRKKPVTPTSADQ